MADSGGVKAAVFIEVCDGGIIGVRSEVKGLDAYVLIDRDWPELPGGANFVKGSVEKPKASDETAYGRAKERR